ncbi:MULTISPECIES: sugar porter family MFS transporter [unclassified Streptomyces]|uniref:sugar porter family MFS transporter n=1 Tax=unclassified Streptomyces TaxID=2593676 RepID=UPI00278BB9C4|nr:MULTISPECIES: sugar porter family MFS transporter [unclassified Streptomyces]
MHEPTPAPSTRHINKTTLYFFGALGGILFGYDLGVISGVLLFIKKQWAMGSVAEGVVGGCLAAGAVIGAAFAGRLADRAGRRGAIRLAAVVFAVGTVGCALAPNLATLVVFRFLIGIAVGGSSATVPMYLTELAPSRLRGALGSLNQLMIVLGIVVAYVVGWAFSGSGNWRAMLAIALVPALALLIGMSFLPETPRWLLARGRDEEAKAVLRAAQGADVDADAAISEIRDIIRLDSERKGTLRDLKAKWVRPALVVALVLAMGQQFSGVNAINVYAPTMFTNLGFSQSTSLIQSILLGIVKFAFTAWVIFVVDRWGRKPLLLIGNILMAVTLTLVGAVVVLVHSQTTAGISAVVLLMIYLAGYELGWGAIVWLMMAEVFPLRVRGVGMGTSSVALWASTFAITFIFPVMNDNLGLAWSSWIFAVVNVVLFLLVWKLVPETKNRSLEQIELDLRARSRLRTTPAGAEPVEARRG